MYGKVDESRRVRLPDKNIHHLYELDFGAGSVEPFMTAFTMKHFLCPGIQILHNMLEFLRGWEETTDNRYTSFSCATLGVKNRQYIVVIGADNPSGFEANAEPILATLPTDELYDNQKTFVSMR